MLQGQMYRRIAQGALDPLTVTAFAVEGGAAKDCAVIVSCDLCGVTNRLQQTVRERFAAAVPGFPTEKLFLVATHTHTSLVLEGGGYEAPDEGVMTPEECTAWLAERAAEAAVTAWQGRAPRAIGRAYGHAVVAHNRRAVYADGSAVMYGSTNRDDFVALEGYEDHSLDLLFVWDPEGKLTGLVIDLPCPSQVDEHLEQYSADYWHEVRQELRARLGADLPVLPLCGAGGDSSPHFLLYGPQEEEMRKRRGVSERQEIAQRVADGVMRALACTTPEAGDTPFAHVVRRRDLTPRQVSRKERDWAESERAGAVERFGADSWWPTRLQRVIDQFEGRFTPDPVPVELHMLRLGDAALVTNPFELYTDYSLRMKARGPAAQTFVVQLAAGTAGYLPSPRAVEGGGYGATPASNAVGPEGGQELVEETLGVIKELFVE